jgi:class 3 adenylate cyclase/CheY-like chemotaxis protein
MASNSGRNYLLSRYCATALDDSFVQAPTLVFPAVMGYRLLCCRHVNDSWAELVVANRDSVHQAEILDENAVRTAEEYRRRKATSVLAIMFTDIAGSTELREQLGEVTYELQREAFDRNTRNLVEAEGAGAIVKSTGDGAFAVFAEPSTAVMKALALQAMLRTHNYFRLRIGIDMGQVAVTSQGGIVSDVFGRQVNRAARIQSIAIPEHVLSSFHVYDCAVGWLIGTNIKWYCHGKATLKGFAEPISIHEPYNPQFVSPQPSSVQAEVENAKSAEAIESMPVVRSIQIRPVKFLSVEQPMNFYGEALGLNVARFLQLTQRRPNILWVDDFPENNEGVGEILRKAGCRLDLATSTSDAVNKLSSSPYTLVITDMGRGDNPTAGLELLDWMRGHAPRTPAIVFCSSRAVEVHGVQASKSGALLCTSGLISLLDGILQVVEQQFYYGECLG